MRVRLTTENDAISLITIDIVAQSQPKVRRKSASGVPGLSVILPNCRE